MENEIITQKSAQVAEILKGLSDVEAGIVMAEALRANNQIMATCYILSTTGKAVKAAEVAIVNRKGGFLLEFRAANGKSLDLDKALKDWDKNLEEIKKGKEE